MKQILSKVLIMSLIGVAVGGYSCKKVTPLPNNPSITLSTQTIRLENEASSAEIEVISNVEWTSLLDSDAGEWLSITPTEGGASAEAVKVIITVKANESALERKGLISFAHKRGAQEVVLTVTQGPKLTPLQKDSLALVDLYNDAKGHAWGSPWDLEEEMNSWAGVFLDVVDGEMRVVKVDLAARLLNGKMPESLANLTAIHTFIITDAAFKQELPEYIATKWPRLTFLALCGSGFFGSIPDVYYDMANIEVMDLYLNQLTGGISPKIGQLTKLTRIQLNNNPLGGTIPAEIGMLKNCYDISLHMCELEGEIPSEIGNMTALKAVQLQSNNLTGSIPESVSTLDKLEHFEVSNCGVSGNLPSFAGCPKLWDIRMSYTNLNGELPKSWATLNSIEVLQLNHNKLTGTIPTEWADIENLNAMILDHNNLTGTLPGYVSNMQYLSVNSNKLTGELPVEMYSSTKLLEIELDSNEFVCVISPDFFRLPSLSKVSIRGMEGVSGTLPVDIEKMKGLQNMYLDGCSFSGEIPASIFTINNLQSLHLKNNDFTGVIPREIITARILAGFSCSGNRLSGALDPLIQKMVLWNDGWDAAVNICPQQTGYVLTNCQ